MGWNGSDLHSKQNNETSAARTRKGKVIGKKRLVSVLAILVAAVIGLFNFLFKDAKPSEDDQNRHEEGKIEKIQEVKEEKSEPATNIIERVIINEPEPFTRGMNGKVERDANGTRWFNGSIVPELRPGEYIRHGKKVSPKKYFKYHSENMIAGKLMMKPGFSSSAKMRSYDRLEADFKESLKEEIVINPDDDQKTRELKEDMIEVKKLIVERMNAGEKFADIYQGLVNELNVIAKTRQELQRLKRELIKNGASDQEIIDHVEASNQILKKYDARSINVPISVKRRILQSESENPEIDTPTETDSSVKKGNDK